MPGATVSNPRSGTGGRAALHPLIGVAAATLATVGLAGCGIGPSPVAEESADPLARGAAAIAAAPARASGEAGATSSPSRATQVRSPPAQPRSPVPELHDGVDVSGHSGAVDWEQVHGAGHTFAFVKATEGVDLRDPAFGVHWARMKEVGVVRGAYHFYVTEDDPEEQAQFFIDNVALESGDLAPVVDLELIGRGTAAEGLQERVRRLLELLEEHYGAAPIVYTSPTFWDRHFDGSFERYPLWIAEYGVEAPRLPGGWTDWHLWQWKDDAAVPGVEKSADLSRVNRSRDDLHRLLVP